MLFQPTQKAELELLKDICLQKGVDVAISEVWAKGADGGIELAEKLLDVLDTKEAHFEPLYDLDLSIADKIKVIAREIYGADDVTFTKKVINKMKKYEAQGIREITNLCCKNTIFII